MKDNIWWTRQSRIETERRLLSNLFHSELLLIWYALCSVVISIYLLETQDDVPQYLFVSFSVMTLAASLYVNTQSYKERSIKIKNCYERLGELYQKYSESSQLYIRKEYLDCLDMCENHTSIDYYRAVIRVKYLASTGNNKNQDGITKTPNWYMYTAFYCYYLSQIVFFRVVLYSLPIVIFIFSKS